MVTMMMTITMINKNCCEPTWMDHLGYTSLELHSSMGHQLTGSKQFSVFFMVIYINPRTPRENHSFRKDKFTRLMWFRGCPKNNIFLHKHSPVLLDASVCTQTCSSWMFCWPSPPSTPTPSQHCWDSCPQPPSWASPCLRQACSSFHQRSCKNSFLDSPFSYVNFELTFIEVSIPKWLVLDSTYPCQKHFPIHLISK